MNQTLDCCYIVEKLDFVNDIKMAMQLIHNISFIFFSGYNLVTFRF